jgi:hypothetical protein
MPEWLNAIRPLSSPLAPEIEVLVLLVSMWTQFILIPAARIASPEIRIANALLKAKQKICRPSRRFMWLDFKTSHVHIEKQGEGNKVFIILEADSSSIHPDVKLPAESWPEEALEKNSRHNFVS